MNGPLCWRQTAALGEDARTQDMEGNAGEGLHLHVLHARLDLGADNLALQKLALALGRLQHLLPLLGRHSFLLDDLDLLAPLESLGRWRGAA
jgi:hypothetical protein